MRLLFWSETFWPVLGGAEVWAARMVTSLAARGFKVLVVSNRSELGTLRLPAIDSYHGIPIRRFPITDAFVEPRRHNPLELREQVGDVRRAFAPDVVHMNSIGPSSMAELWTRSAHRAPTLATLHGWTQRFPPDTPSLRGVLESAARVVGVSEAVLADTIARVPSIRSRCSVIHNAMDLPALPPTSLPTDPATVLFLGRLSSEKGFDMGLDAFAILARRLPKVRLLVAGDGPDYDALVTHCRRLGLDRHTEFLGWVAPEAVPAVINRATVVALPSQREAFPLVALEAAAMARPVVACSVGGLPEAVVHGTTGLLIPPADVAAFATALAALLDDPERATNMGLAARARVERDFAWNRCVTAYEELYAALANGGRTC